MTLSNSLAALADTLKEWRQDLHQHPELGYQETRTSALIVEKLQSFGVDDIKVGLGKTGVVATIHGNGGAAKDESEAILLRADMDALPIHERTDHAYRSKHDGKMHACGHDGHTTMLLGAAKQLAATRNFKGTAYLCFQPAEEGGAGAKAMIEDGLFEQFPCKEVYGMHNWPGIEPGNFSVRSGPIMAIAGEFKITLTGKGGHAAMPHLNRDVILAGSALVQALQSIVSRRIDPNDPVVLSVTTFHSGDTFNVMPDTAEISGTIRSFNQTVHQAVYAELDKITAEICGAYGVHGAVDHGKIPYPPTVNAPVPTEQAANAAAALVGEEHVNRQGPASMGGEDFAYMTDIKPGCYIMIGNGDSAPLHHSQYDFNDEIAPLGVAYWLKLVETVLSKPQEH